MIHFESEIDRLVYQLYGLTNEKPTVAVCYPCKTLINSLMPTVAIRDTSHDIRALPHEHLGQVSVLLHKRVGRFDSLLRTEEARRECLFKLYDMTVRINDDTSFRPSWHSAFSLRILLRQGCPLQ